MVKDIFEKQQKERETICYQSVKRDIKKVTIFFKKIVSGTNIFVFSSLIFGQTVNSTSTDACSLKFKEKWRK